MAHILDRTLILPMMGYRAAAHEDWDFSFNILRYHWYPMETYFSEAILAKHLPCRIVSMENFQAAYPDVTLDALLFNPFGKATVGEQLVDYYHKLLGFKYRVLLTTPRHYQLEAKEIRAFYNDTRPLDGAKTSFTTASTNVLALGCTFWLYGFDRFDPYPKSTYLSYIDDPLYASITNSLHLAVQRRTSPSPSVFSLFQQSVSRDRIGSTSIPFSMNTIAHHIYTAYKATLPSKRSIVLAIHLRRGDYWNKCKSIQNEEQRHRCYPTIDNVLNNLRTLSKGIPKPVYLYIATNAVGSGRKDLEPLEKAYSVSYFDTAIETIRKHNQINSEEGGGSDERNEERALVVALLDIVDRMDPIETAFLDKLFCAQADMFVGNIYSSFSRSIMEFRELKKRQFSNF
jgi:hypothetical protein